MFRKKILLLLCLVFHVKPRVKALEIIDECCSGMSTPVYKEIRPTTEYIVEEPVPKQENSVEKTIKLLRGDPAVEYVTESAPEDMVDEDYEEQKTLPLLSPEPTPALIPTPTPAPNIKIEITQTPQPVTVTTEADESACTNDCLETDDVSPAPDMLLHEPTEEPEITYEEKKYIPVKYERPLRTQESYEILEFKPAEIRTVYKSQVKPIHHSQYIALYEEPVRQEKTMESILPQTVTLPSPEPTLALIPAPIAPNVKKEITQTPQPVTEKPTTAETDESACTNDCLETDDVSSAPDMLLLEPTEAPEFTYEEKKYIPLKYERPLRTQESYEILEYKPAEIRTEYISHVKPVHSQYIALYEEAVRQKKMIDSVLSQTAQEVSAIPCERVCHASVGCCQ